MPLPRSGTAWGSYQASGKTRRRGNLAASRWIAAGVGVAFGGGAGGLPGAAQATRRLDARSTPASP
jgi:hypothetical protein